MNRSVILATVWLAGCISPEEMQRRQDEYVAALEQACAQQGYSPGSAANIKCALDLHEQAQRIRGMNQPRTIVMPMPQQQPARPIVNSPTTTNCQRNPSGSVTCTTY